MSADCPSTASVAAAMVTFNPDLELFVRALASLTTQVDTIFVIDNNSHNATQIEAACRNVHALFKELNANKGIATALNSAFALAENHGKQWLLTCDQDSILPSDLTTALTTAACDHDSDAALGIVCPNFLNRTTGVREFEGGAPRMIERCISSGSLTSVGAWRKIGGFDDVMFIDSVDFEFCERLGVAGYGILLVPDVCIDHEIGDARLHHIFGRSFYVFHHPAFRNYFIAQNIVYIAGKRNNGKPGMRPWLQLCKQYLLVLLYERDKIAKVEALSKGTIHGFAMCHELRKR